MICPVLNKRQPVELKKRRKTTDVPIDTIAARKFNYEEMSITSIKFPQQVEIHRKRDPERGNLVCGNYTVDFSGMAADIAEIAC